MQNVRIENSEGHGIHVRGNSRVANSTIDLGGTLGRGIFLSGFGFRIQDNIVLNAGQAGIGMSPTTSSGSALITGNVVRISGAGIDVDVNSVLANNLVE